MADAAASVLALQPHSMPLMAHLEELRKRIIFSVVGVVVGFFGCWSYADRIFGLVQQPLIQALRHHGLAGGLVYLNPTEPFNLYLEVGLVAGLFAASPFCVLSVVVVHCSWTVSYGKTLCSPVRAWHGGIVHIGRVFRLQDGLPGVTRFSHRLRRALSTHDYDWGICEAVCDNYRRPRANFRNAGSGVLSCCDARHYGALDVAKFPVFRTRDFCGRRNDHTDHRYLEYVSFCCPHGCALRRQHRCRLAGRFGAPAQNGCRLVCAEAKSVNAFCPRRRDEIRPQVN